MNTLLEDVQFMREPERKGQVLIDVVVVYACIFIIFLKTECWSIGQREVGEETAVLILITKVVQFVERS